MTLKYAQLFVLVSMALVSDLKTGKIKNRLTVSFMALGLATNLLMDGVAGIRDSLAGWLAPMLLLFVLYALRMMGAGDIKLFSAVGAIMGLQFSLWTMAFSFLCGGVMALIVMVSRKKAAVRMRSFFTYLKSCLLGLTLLPYDTQTESKDGGTFPFAAAIAAGALAAVVYGRSF